MHVKNYIGRFFDESKLASCNPNYYSDDAAHEGKNCYKVILQSGYDNDYAPMYAYYYLEIIVDLDNRIEAITRYIDECAFTNFARTRFPLVFEEESEALLKECTT